MAKKNGKKPKTNTNYIALEAGQLLLETIGLGSRFEASCIIRSSFLNCKSPNYVCAGTILIGTLLPSEDASLAPNQPVVLNLKNGKNIIDTIHSLQQNKKPLKEAQAGMNVEICLKMTRFSEIRQALHG